MTSTTSSFFISRRRVYQCLGVFVLVGLVIAGLGLVSGAQAQTPPGGRGSGAGEANATLSCFDSKRTVARVWEQFVTINSFDFVNIPAAGLNMVVPPGTDCLTVRFSTRINCNNAGVYWFRATLNGTPMSPTGVLGQASDQFILSYSWTQIVTVSTQTTFLAQVQLRTGDGTVQPAIPCSVQGWTLEVERKD
jgi:hypothetical protein